MKLVTKIRNGSSFNDSPKALAHVKQKFKIDFFEQAYVADRA